MSPSSVNGKRLHDELQMYLSRRLQAKRCLNKRPCLFILMDNAVISIEYCSECPIWLKRVGFPCKTKKKQN